jgi:phosphoenolpyruvate synthase/pyruvate phosphate dikinase
VIVPPLFRDEEEYKLDWDKINTEVSGTPVLYPLTLRGERSGEEEEEEEEVPLLPVVCHRVKVQR